MPDTQPGQTPGTTITNAAPDDATPDLSIPRPAAGSPYELASERDVPKEDDPEEVTAEQHPTALDQPAS